MNQSAQEALSSLADRDLCQSSLPDSKTNQTNQLESAKQRINESRFAGIKGNLFDAVDWFHRSVDTQEATI